MRVSLSMTALLLFSTGWSYYCGNRIRDTVHILSRKRWLLAGIIPCIGVLFIFKYYNFFIDNISALIQRFGIAYHPSVLKLIMPLGISYYIFKIISYLIDIYKGKITQGYHFGLYALYISFFPQITAGPIERAEYFMEQFIKKDEAVLKRFLPLLVNEGIYKIVLGLFKKFVIANRLSEYVDKVYSDPAGYTGIALWLSAFFFSIQIYCDFSGYSDIAIGITNLLGIHSKKNFNYPYLSGSVKEFWRNWHISLSSWLKDYIYIPLGGNRVSKIRKTRNILLTFLVSGLWHGANWTFVFWGGLHGIANVFSKGKQMREEGFWRPIKVIVTFIFVTFAWIFFRADTIRKAFLYIKYMFVNLKISGDAIQAAILPFTFDNTCIAYFLTVIFFISALFVKEFVEKYKPEKAKESWKQAWLVFLSISTILFGVFGTSGFLYANF